MQSARQDECDAITGAVAGRQHIVESLIRDVRDVHHHPQAIHFAHDLLAEIAEPVMRGLIGGRIGPIGIDHVRERHIAHAEGVEFIEVGQRIVDHVAAFDTHQDGDFTVSLGGANFSGRGAQDEIVRMARYSFADCADLHQRALHRRRSRDRPGNVNREENRAQAAFAHARDVYAAVRVPRAEVEFRIEQALSGVVVRVNHDRAEMKFTGLRRNSGIRLAGYGCERQKSSE